MTDFWQPPQQRAGRLRVGSAYSNHCGGDVRRASRADRRLKIVTDCSGEGCRASDWGLQQFGIRAVIAPSFAEIFYSNTMNNRLLLVALAEDQIAVLMKAADDPTDLVGAHRRRHDDRDLLRSHRPVHPAAASPPHVPRRARRDRPHAHLPRSHRSVLRSTLGAAALGARRGEPYSQAPWERVDLGRTDERLLRTYRVDRLGSRVPVRGSRQQSFSKFEPACYFRRSAVP